MNKKLICILVIFCMLLSVQNVVGPATTSAGSSASGGGGGGGGSKQVDIDRLLKAVEDGKKNKPEEFEELKTLLWKDPITSENYTLPLVLMYYGGNNTTVSRTEPIEIITVIKNNNLPEMRRMLDLYLEAKEPGSDEYRKINLFPNKIQANEYNAKTNITQRIWNDLPSFAYLKQIGEVRLRVNASDGVHKWSTASYKDLEPPFYSELVFNVTNSLPRMSEFNITPAGLARYNDPIEYRANIEDEDGDLLNVTLHILDENGIEIRNETINTKPGPVSFKANEYGFFTEDDAGKNFTYYYSYDDSINFTSKDPTEPLSGPKLRKGAKLAVDRLGFFFCQRELLLVGEVRIQRQSQKPQPGGIRCILHPVYQDRGWRMDHCGDKDGKDRNKSRGGLFQPDQAVPGHRCRQGFSIPDQILRVRSERQGFHREARCCDQFQDRALSHL